MTDRTPAEPIEVIVVEDDPDLREEVVDYLLAKGLNVREAASGATLDRLLGAKAADVVVLDLGLPNEDGIAVANRLRSRAEPVGIVMMTARARVEERILGYDTGADVYLVKPVDYRELLAAIRATRRNRPTGGPASAGEPASDLTWRLDLAAWRRAAPAGAAIRLTRAEAQLLECLTEDPGRPVSRDTIAERMGKLPTLGEHRYVDQVVSRLRRKIATNLGWDAPIGAAHGQGYYVIDSVKRTEA
jgi:DNA-binding response OmpR family regulator